MSKDNLIVIKKYPNRRLYNTQTSKYITLEDLTNLIKSDVEFKVIDVKTNEDVTRITLTQIILNHEIDGYNLLPIELVKQTIKFYDHPLSKVYSNFMLESLKQFNNFYGAYYDKAKELGDFTKFFESISDAQTQIFEAFFGGNKKR